MGMGRDASSVAGLSPFTPNCRAAEVGWLLERY
jgi:hypothetical protein